MFLADATIILTSSGAVTIALTAVIRLCWRRGKSLEQP